MAYTSVEPMSHFESITFECEGPEEYGVEHATAEFNLTSGRPKKIVLSIVDKPLVTDEAPDSDFYDNFDCDLPSNSRTVEVTYEVNVGDARAIQIPPITDPQCLYETMRRSDAAVAQLTCVDNVRPWYGTRPLIQQIVEHTPRPQLLRELSTMDIEFTRDEIAAIFSETGDDVQFIDLLIGAEGEEITFDAPSDDDGDIETVLEDVESDDD